MKEITNTSAGADPKVAKRIAEGLTLVPYYGYGPDGRRCPLCQWVKLKPGESVEQAASRLTARYSGKIRQP